MGEGGKAFVWVYVGDEGGVVSVWRVSMGRLLTNEGFLIFFFFSIFHFLFFYFLYLTLHPSSLSLSPSFSLLGIRNLDEITTKTAVKSLCCSNGVVWVGGVGQISRFYQRKKDNELNVFEVHGGRSVQVIKEVERVQEVFFFF